MFVRIELLGILFSGSRVPAGRDFRPKSMERLAMKGGGV